MSVSRCTKRDLNKSILYAYRCTTKCISGYKLVQISMQISAELTVKIKLRIRTQMCVQIETNRFTISVVSTQVKT